MGPAEVVEAVKLALRQYPALNPVTLVGDETILRPLVQHAGISRRHHVHIHHASEVVTMDDKPLMALKRKKDSSMVRAIELVKEGQASVVVSCGNTGALMACGTLKLRTMEGVARPALAAVVPRENGHFVLIDAGANPEAKPEHLVHNAILGSHDCRVMLGIASPRVGLMTIGTEDGKGNALFTETNDLLRHTSDIIHFSGPIEGFQFFADHVDVVVCDGFV
ncbi:MAG: fatty acid/phospholipid synthesis protein PlsX, partial [Verrucomicrobia bacterium]|nr:fatty acid/phospholipid synthesis protein PlsX [Verrucomicrobiota bacterium]